MKVTKDSYTIIAAKHELAEAYKTSYLETQKALGGVLQADSLNLRNIDSRIDRAFEDSDLHKILLHTNYKPYGESLEDFMQLISHDKAYISNLAVVEAASEMGYNELRIVASGENVCKYCKSMDGKIVKTDDESNIPPFHPNCNCTVVPVSIRLLNDNPYVYEKTQVINFFGPVRSITIKYDVHLLKRYFSDNSKKNSTFKKPNSSSTTNLSSWLTNIEKPYKSTDYIIDDYGKKVAIKPHNSNDGYITVGYGHAIQSNTDANKYGYSSGNKQAVSSVSDIIKKQLDSFESYEDNPSILTFEEAESLLLDDLRKY